VTRLCQNPTIYPTLWEKEIVGANCRAIEQCYSLIFDRKFLFAVVERMPGNEAIYKRVLDDEDFQKALMGL
jgi:hypothetical protein